MGSESIATINSADRSQTEEKRCRNELNAQNEDGDTPLHQLLLSINSDRNFLREFEEGRYEHSDARVSGKVSKIPTTIDAYDVNVRGLLASPSIDVNLKNNDGETPLDVAQNLGLTTK